MLFGRKREIERLRDALRPGATIALVGAAGIGKTSIARALSDELGGVVVDCRACSDGELDQRFVDAFGEQGFDPDVALVVLDDWTMAMDLGRVRSRYAGPILLTSFDTPTGATPLPIPPLPTTGDDAAAALELFAHEAERSLLGAMERCAAEDVACLVEMVGGHPLGIALAAQHAAAMGAHEVVTLMRRGVELRDDGRPPRQRSLAVALETSWRALGADAQVVMYAASRFRRPVGVSALAEVTGQDVATILEVIGDLARRGALRPGPYPHPPSMWRDVALTKFAADDPKTAATVDDGVFGRALALAREDANLYQPRAVDDAPSYWEAALEHFDGRPRADVGAIVTAALNWGKRFAVGRFAPDYLERATLYSELWEAHITRARMLRQNYGRNKDALERALAVATQPNEEARTYFEMALNELDVPALDLTYDYLRRARALDDLYEASMLEIELLLAHGDRAKAARLIEPLLHRPAPKVEPHQVLRTFEVWCTEPASRLERAREFVAATADGTAFAHLVSRGTLADVLERDYGEVDEPKALREEVLAIVRESKNPAMIAGAEADVAWGRFIVDPSAAADALHRISLDAVFNDTRKRIAVARAMLAVVNGKPEQAEQELTPRIRNTTHVPPLLEEFAVVDTAIALLLGRTPPPQTPVTDLMNRAWAARHGSTRELIDAHEEAMALKSMSGWAPRLALYWIRSAGPELYARLERVAAAAADVMFLDDFSALHAQGHWHHVPPTSAALLRLLSSGEPASFSELQQAAWPDEIVDWESVVNRVNVRISQLRSMGLKRYLQKTAEGFVLTCEIYVEPAPTEPSVGPRGT